MEEETHTWLACPSLGNFKRRELISCNRILLISILISWISNEAMSKQFSKHGIWNSDHIVAIVNVDQRTEWVFVSLHHTFLTIVPVEPPLMPQLGGPYRIWLSSPTLGLIYSPVEMQRTVLQQWLYLPGAWLSFDGHCCSLTFSKNKLNF